MIYYFEKTKIYFKYMYNLGQLILEYTLLIILNSINK